jgi:hypothetical protein
MLAAYRDKLFGTAPAFPARSENRITASLLLSPDVWGRVTRNGRFEM